MSVILKHRTYSLSVFEWIVRCFGNQWIWPFFIFTKCYNSKREIQKLEKCTNRNITLASCLKFQTLPTENSWAYFKRCNLPAVSFAEIICMLLSTIKVDLMVLRSIPYWAFTDPFSKLDAALRFPWIMRQIMGHWEAMIITQGLDSFWASISYDPGRLKFLT